MKKIEKENSNYGLASLFNLIGIFTNEDSEDDKRRHKRK